MRTFLQLCVIAVSYTHLGNKSEKFADSSMKISRALNGIEMNLVGTRELSGHLEIYLDTKECADHRDNDATCWRFDLNADGTIAVSYTHLKRIFGLCYLLKEISKKSQFFVHNSKMNKIRTFIDVYKRQRFYYEINKNQIQKLKNGGHKEIFEKRRKELLRIGYLSQLELFSQDLSLIHISPPPP